jgi:long-chain acyl-CoA synthetase
MYLADHARDMPEKPAMIFSDGTRISFAELDEWSNRLAQLLHARGLRRGDHIAIFMENNPRYFEAVWAALRSGLYITPINRCLTGEEAVYIANDCGARAIVSSYARRDVATQLPRHLPGCGIWLMTDGVVDGWESYETVTAEYPGTALADERTGDSMFYSSGTTGKPKGILRPLPDVSPADGFALRQVVNRYEISSETVYLSPAPLYHAAPFAFVLSVQSFGGTVVIMEKFDAALALDLIERHRVRRRPCSSI